MYNIIYSYLWLNLINIIYKDLIYLSSIYIIQSNYMQSNYMQSNYMQSNYMQKKRKNKTKKFPKYKRNKKTKSVVRITRRGGGGLSNIFTRPSRKGSYDVTTTTTTSKFNTEITTILADKQKAIQTALSAPDFAPKFDLISEQDLKTLRIDEIIKQMLQEKKEKLQVRIPSDLVRISDEMLKTVSIDEIVEQVLRKKKEELRILKINEIKQQCNESTVCMALGMYTNDIKEHFNNFTDFTFVNDIALITNTAGNGFVNSIKYFRENFTAYAILKSNLNRKSDNLLYEYMVGLYLNTLNKRFPCFLETYGYYTYVDNSSELRLALQTIYETNIDKNLKIQKAIKTNLILEQLNYANVNNADTMDEVYINACGPLKQAILIQYFNNVMTFSDFLKANNVFDNDVFTEFIHILFQVYFPLAHLKDSFTHYDLHSSNVLLYKPAEKKYIEYN